MFGRFLPREENFFALFRAIADQIVAGSLEFKKMVEDIGNAATHCATIKDIEHKGDEITHNTVALLHKTFITPMDREDIHLLISRLDDILDFIDAAAQRISLYGIKKAPPEMSAMAQICVEAAEKIRTAVNGLQDLSSPGEIEKCCVEINRLENEADQVLRSGVAKLFRDEPDTRELIKQKEILELLETVTDRCEDVANVIDGMVLEYA